VFNKASILDFPLTILTITPLDTWWHPGPNKDQGSLKLEKNTHINQADPTISAKSVRVFAKFGYAYPINEVTNVNNISRPCVYHIPPLKGKGKKTFCIFVVISNL
jgi:hypothetical protein